MGRARGHFNLAGGTPPPRSGPRGPYKWARERIHEELDGFLGDRKTWPTVSEFRAAGENALLDAVERYGGPEFWAAEMGVARPTSSRRRALPLPVLLDQARRVMADHGGRLPNTRRLRGLGLRELAYHVQQSGGAQAFTRQHHLPPFE